MIERWIIVNDVMTTITAFVEKKNCSERFDLKLNLFDQPY